MVFVVFGLGHYKLYKTQQLETALTVPLIYCLMISFMLGFLSAVQRQKCNSVHALVKPDTKATVTQLLRKKAS